MCVSWHPEQPAVVAGGTFSGDIRIWNTGLSGDPLLASSGLSDLGHKEPVAKVCVCCLNPNISIIETNFWILGDLDSE